MDLIFFDLDGTLLNDASQISAFTKDTLFLLGEKDIAYTVATGRSLLSAQPILAGHDFALPHIYSNGVTIWDPKTEQLELENLLNKSEVSTVVDIAAAHGIAVFVNVTDSNNNHLVFHGETLQDVEKNLIDKYFSKTSATLMPLHSLPDKSNVTNISMIGVSKVINAMWLELNNHPNLIAYSGEAHEGVEYSWMDVHHCDANKGSAVINLKQRLGASNVICFGDSDNDLSMFALADESYAPENARAEIKKSVNAVIGHNHADGIAHFLRERFSL